MFPIRCSDAINNGILWCNSSAIFFARFFVNGFAELQADSNSLIFVIEFVISFCVI